MNKYSRTLVIQILQTGSSSVIGVHHLTITEQRLCSYKCCYNLKNIERGDFGLPASSVVFKHLYWHWVT